MIKILFKAKRIDNGEWVVGFFVNAREEYGHGERTAEIITMKAERICNGEYSYTEAFVVDETTICQYTGFTDKNGNKVWENDVIECEDGKRHFKSQVEWDEKEGCFIFQDSHTSFVGLDAIGEGGCYRDCIVVCNIFDNPDLIGEQNG